ncbi:foxred2 [Symbiodinium natans]|uniref:Foxred2 protein n=1 Tax=Symbiodinium natans TaxID=878477 RepID=A0A812IC31_9DINO|nr:foxred2 [Symbiodinium natans]
MAQHSLCIVGAGPAGLQLGHLLEKDASQPGDFVIFEKADTPGNFFRRFPVHRMLISLNKRHTRSQSAEFRMRHDWNSLIGTGDVGISPVTARTTELYPHADVVATYLEDFGYHLQKKILYNSEVLRVLPSSGHFDLDLARPSGRERHRCGRVVLASGLKPNKPSDIIGEELLLGYEDLPKTGQAFENQSVLVWGFGNAAHETSREVQKFTQAVTLLHRTPPPSPLAPRASALPRFAFFTHYPGDIRTVTMQIYDSYLLKALDVKLAYAGEEEEPVFLRCLRRLLCVWVSKRSRCGGAGDERRILPNRVVPASAPRQCAVSVGPMEAGDRVAAPLLTLLRSLTRRGLAVEGRDFAWEAPAGEHPAARLQYAALDSGKVAAEEGSEEWLPQVPIYFRIGTGEGLAWNAAFARRGRRLELSSEFLATQRPLMDLVARLRPLLSQDPLRHPFHAGIRCLGWRAALPDVANLTETGKYPIMDASYQSTAIPGLFFAGALSHGRDYRRSAGGFIHGFRYTARALHRILRYKQAGWPNASYAVDEEPWMRQVLGRINEAAGPYQMFGELVDVLLFKAGPGGLRVHYFEEVPMAYAQENSDFRTHPRLLLSFVYGRQFSPGDLPSPGAVGAEFAELSAFLHPRLELFEASPGAGHCLPVVTHSVVEDVFTDWQSFVGHVDPLFRFLDACARMASEWLQVKKARRA